LRRPPARRLRLHDRRRRIAKDLFANAARLRRLELTIEDERTAVASGQGEEASDGRD
jgi:hypothetical protein